MQTYICSKISEKVSRTYGGATVTVQVYRQKRTEGLVPVCQVTWCTRGWCGGYGVHDVLQGLARNGILPKKYGHSYYTGDVPKKYRILPVGNI